MALVLGSTPAVTHSRDPGSCLGTSYFKELGPGIKTDRTVELFKANCENLHKYEWSSIGRNKVFFIFYFLFIIIFFFLKRKGMRSFAVFENCSSITKQRATVPCSGGTQYEHSRVANFP